MGSSRWSDDAYTSRGAAREAKGEAAFAYHKETESKPRTEHKAHASLDPKGVKIRESRDSEAHPEAHAVAVLFDVTGSMKQVPEIMQKQLPQLMGLLIRKGYLPHPAIMVGAIGDATCDRVPLQVGQFESGIEIDDNLTNIFLEGNGGSYGSESYELAMYFMARHTTMDCLEKRGKRGYLFIIGDEEPYKHVKTNEVVDVIGDAQPDAPTTEALVAELEKMYDVYFIIPALTCGSGNATVKKAGRTVRSANGARIGESGQHLQHDRRYHRPGRRSYRS